MSGRARRKSQQLKLIRMNAYRATYSCASHTITAEEIKLAYESPQEWVNLVYKQMFEKMFKRKYVENAFRDSDYIYQRLTESWEGKK